MDPYPHANDPLLLRSPDGRVAVAFYFTDGGAPTYEVTYDRQPITLPSTLGLTLAEAPGLDHGFRLDAVDTREVNITWTPPYGERAIIHDRYRETHLDLLETEAPGRRLHLLIRAYNEGAAWRYVLPQQPKLTRLTITEEGTVFRFPTGCEAYEEHGTEGEYVRVPVAQIAPKCERPLTIAYPHGKWACLVEAATVDYARMLLSPVELGESALRTDLDGPVRGSTPLVTPWRGFIVGDRPGDLLERNDLVRNLNPPCVLKDTSWIRPGKAIREVTLSTVGGKACVDFAVSHNLQYVEYDAGWYGHEYDEESDATTVTPDPERTDQYANYGGLDLQEVIRYAEDRGIGVLLYVNRRQLERQLDELLPLYARWGVAGIKFGFVQVGPQKWTRWLHDAVRKCAAHKLLVDIHDAYRPTGFSRTYPNLLTQEGVRGNEHMPTARHNCTLPFCRFPAGAADVTICYYDPRVQPTHAHQLAMAVIVYSPLQFLFWYDRPSEYQGEPEIAFWEAVPTTWDDTRVLGGEIGEFVAIARRAGREWFLGAITNEQERILEIPLDFLEIGEYVAEIYYDDPQVDTRTQVSVGEWLVDAQTTMRISLPPSGGQAIQLRPADAHEVAVLGRYVA
jgi:alpha-glucosidase